MLRTPVVFAVLLTAALPAQAGDPSGLWRLSDGKVTVKVSNCGKGLCGRIVALKKPLDKHGNPKLDKENPNPALRSRPVIGLSLLQDMQPSGEGHWEGAIYNPDDGRTYAAKMTVNGDVMKVKGCIVVFCKTKEFQRLQ
jgi:uncharacterized protein (DUF2147 family)